MSLLRAFFGFFAELFRREGDPKGRRRILVLLAGLVLIILWQHGFAKPGVTLDQQYRVTASRGHHQEDQFFFFLYHLGLYPVKSMGPPITEDTDASAERELRKNPAVLQQEEGLTFRSGDHGRIHLLYVDALIHHRSIGAQLGPANSGAFVLALCVMFAGFWWIRRPALGTLAVAFLGSNPLQLFSVYGDENYFSWPITSMMLVLGLNLPLFDAKKTKSRAVYVLPALTGLVLAGARTIRGEPAALMVSALMIYAFASRLSWKTRAIHAGAAIAVFLAGNAIYKRAIDAKMEHTKQVLRDVGAKPYEGPSEFHHELWHPIWCGLGDFDTKYGHKWDDLAAYKAVLPELEKEAGHKLDLDPNIWRQKEHWADDPRYPKYFFDTPGYHETVRELVLRDIERDPIWYVGILWDRAKRILSETTPLALQWGSTRWDGGGEMLGWFTLPLLAFLCAARRWFYVKLILFSLPLSLTALLVYSGSGTTFYSCFHIFAALATIALVMEGARHFLARPRP